MWGEREFINYSSCSQADEMRYGRSEYSAQYMVLSGYHPVTLFARQTGSVIEVFVHPEEIVCSDRPDSVLEGLWVVDA